jgi:hypothetical protein
LNEFLASILLHLDELSDQAAEKITHQKYIELYMNHHTHTGMIGVQKTHDGDTVIFHEDRFRHAFYTNSEGTYSKFRKDKFDRDRAIRICWIGQIIQGNISSVYYDAPDNSRRDSYGRIIIKRLYVLWEENYLVWLEPQKKGGWKFSTAYVANKPYIRQITRGLIPKKISRD